MAAKKKAPKKPIVVAPPKQNDPGLVASMAKTAAIAGTATVAVAGTSAAINAVTGPSAAEQQAAAEKQTMEEQQAAAEQQATEEQQEDAEKAATAGLTEEQVQQLRDLASLRDSGILTNEEFEAQKAEILAA